MSGRDALARTGVPVLLAVLLSSCVPVPLLPGLSPASRSNLGADAASTLAIGRSTREDVLFALGEPDHRGVDDRWFGYESARSLGGVVLMTGAPQAGVLAWHERVRHRSLVVRFDAHGVVTDLRAAERVCGGWKLGEQDAGPCLDATEGLAWATTAERLDASAWLPTEPGERLLENFVSAALRTPLGWHEGAAFVTSRAVYFLDREAEGEPVSRVVFRWPLESVAAAEQHPAEPDAVLLRHAGGRDETLLFRRLTGVAPDPGQPPDRARAERFIEAIRLQQAPRRTAPP